MDRTRGPSPLSRSFRPGCDSSSCPGLPGLPGSSPGFAPSPGPTHAPRRRGQARCKARKTRPPEKSNRPKQLLATLPCARPRVCTCVSSVVPSPRRSLSFPHLLTSSPPHLPSISCCCSSLPRTFSAFQGAAGSFNTLPPPSPRLPIPTLPHHHHDRKTRTTNSQVYGTRLSVSPDLGLNLDRRSLCPITLPLDPTLSLSLTHSLSLSRRHPALQLQLGYGTHLADHSIPPA